MRTCCLFLMLPYSDAVSIEYDVVCAFIRFTFLDGLVNCFNHTSFQAYLRPRSQPGYRIAQWTARGGLEKWVVVRGRPRWDWE